MIKPCSIRPCHLPDSALLRPYLENGSYTDCFTTDINKPITHAQYVTAFYTTFVFKLERLLLKWLVSKPSTDIDASQLAENKIEQFSAWTVEARNEQQILMCDYQSRTRSWLMIESIDSGAKPITRLYFGSAVIRIKHKKTGEMTMGAAFHLLSGFHKIYSRILLCSAIMRLNKAY